jgi:hypothetical protein
MNFGVTGDAAPKAASSSVARYSLAARQALSLTSSGFHSSLATERCFLASGNQAGVDGEPIGSDQPFGHAALDDGFEQMAQQIALAKAPVPVLGKGRMVARDLAIQTEPTKPAVREIKMLPLLLRGNSAADAIAAATFSA